MNRIKSLREEFNYTQQDLAQKLDCSKSVIGLYESETRKPSMEVLLKLSDIFDCSIDYIIGKSDIRNPEKADLDKLQIGLSAKDYSNITDEQLKQIEDFAKFVLKDNKNDKKEK